MSSLDSTDIGINNIHTNDVIKQSIPETTSEKIKKYRNNSKGKQMSPSRSGRRRYSRRKGRRRQGGLATNRGKRRRNRTGLRRRITTTTNSPQSVSVATYDPTTLSTSTTTLKTTTTTTTTTPRIMKIPEYNVDGGIESENEIVSIITEGSRHDSVDYSSPESSAHSRDPAHDKHVLRNLIESTSNNDLLSNLETDDSVNVINPDAHGRPQAVHDPLILLYKKIASKRAKKPSGRRRNNDGGRTSNRHQTKNRQVTTDNSETNLEFANEPTELEQNEKLQDLNRNNVNDYGSKTITNDIFSEDYDNVEDNEIMNLAFEYDENSPYRGHRNDLNPAVDNDTLDQDYEETNAEIPKESSQELPEGYPTDRLNQEDPEYSNSR